MLRHAKPPALFAVLFALLASVAALRAEEPLTSVEALRALPPAAVAAGREVQLSGAVTYLRVTPNDFNFILDDGTGGVMIYPPQRLPLQFGQRATVRGTAQLDWPFLRIHATTVTVGQPGALPAPLAATPAELLAGRLEGRFVQMEAMVRVVRLEGPQLTPRRLALDFGARGSRLTAWISRYEGAESRFVPGARVRVAGVCVRWRNDRAQPVSTSLLINSPADVADISPATTQPLEALADLLLWTGLDEPTALRETSGVVTFHEPGELVVLQEGDRALRVRPAPAGALHEGENAAPLALGTRVKVSGFPVLGEYTTELEDARWRVIGPAEIPRAESFPDADALLAMAGLVDREARLVSLPATVREVRSRDGRGVIEMASAGHSFTAWLPAGEPLPSSIRAGAELRVSGICTLHLSEERRRLGRYPGDFSLLLRGPADIEILRAAPWWTPGRLFGALGALMVIAAMSALWAAWLGRKNAQLVAEIAARRRAENLLAGERRRMAADLHDTLDQTLLAAGLQLGAASRTLTAAPDAASAQIALAHQLLARGQQEVRDAVWDLHAGDAQPQQLDALLARACAEAAARTTAGVSFSVEGEPRPLPPFLVAQSVRLVREAVANALKHGEPRCVKVTLTFFAREIRLQTSDDGRGFDARDAAGPETGHFGLTGLRERLQRLGGTLEIVSSPGTGATLTATIPLPEK